MSRDDVAADLRLAVGRLGRRLRQHAVGGLSASQLSALATLDRHGPLPMGRLSRLEGVAPPTVTRVVDWLQEQGLVDRRADSADARCTLVAISAAGRRALSRARNERTAYLAARLTELDDDEVRLLADALPVLRKLAEDPE